MLPYNHYYIKVWTYVTLVIFIVKTTLSTGIRKWNMPPINKGKSQWNVDNIKFPKAITFNT